jgi:hypothetical protein
MNKTECGPNGVVVKHNHSYQMSQAQELDGSRIFPHNSQIKK